MGQHRTPSATEATAEIVEHLFALVDRMRHGLEATAAAFELSVAQAKTLRYLAEAGPVPMRDLAVRLRCDASNVTGIVDRLEQRGLVERRAAAGDRRVKSLVITIDGEALARAVWEQVMIGAAAMVALGDDERRTLLVLLRRIDADPAAGFGPGPECRIAAEQAARRLGARA